MFGKTKETHRQQRTKFLRKGRFDCAVPDELYEKVQLPAAITGPVSPKTDADLANTFGLYLRSDA